jgi:hypothetical protein
MSGAVVEGIWREISEKEAIWKMTASFHSESCRFPALDHQLRARFQRNLTVTPA